jgi:hypothetical protein
LLARDCCDPLKSRTCDEPSKRSLRHKSETAAAATSGQGEGFGSCGSLRDDD